MAKMIKVTGQYGAAHRYYYAETLEAYVPEQMEVQYTFTDEQITGMERLLEVYYELGKDTPATQSIKVYRQLTGAGLHEAVTLAKLAKATYVPF